ncbi:TonB-dependent receptor [Nevskia ramosa]|uniref:TonB-dependent receptor n=1 Tax=Nevskia ramosa TaxID=64002 RepID=UPI0023530810
MIRRILLLSLLATAWPAAAQQPAAAPQEEPVQLAPVRVIGVAPTDNQGVPLDRYPGNAQAATAEDIQNAQSQSLSDFMSRKLGSVFVSDAQNNPYQPDLFYRGYSISPLLGLPQGLALYIDGMRVNETFGDVVNWDLIPDAAIQSLQLVPGSNPVFGQNTLAGALTLRTKSGFDLNGTRIELGGGSFGRYGTSVEQGWSQGHYATYIAGEYDREDGWRDFSPSRIGRLFAKGSYLDEKSSADLSVTLADNRLTGNGAAPVALLEREGRGRIFTYPDLTEPRLGAINLQASHRYSKHLDVSGGLSFRRNYSKSLNGDGTEYEACAENGPFLCAEEADGEQVLTTPNGNPIVASAANDSATINTSSTDQQVYAFRGQVTLSGDNVRNRLIIGSTAELGRARFASQTELGALTEDRGAEGSGEQVLDSFVRLRTRKYVYSGFVVANYSPIEPLDITAAASLNHTHIVLRDLGEDDDLNGNHRYTRLNPSIGATWKFTPGLTGFANYAESARAPTPVELTCADPNDPCRLPNGFVSDPPLHQVVTRTIETGLRWNSPNYSGSIALFNSANNNDILFITDGDLTTEGYFDNVGETRRRGIEFGGNYRITNALSFNLQYTYLDAQFLDGFLVNSPNHPVRNPDDPEESADSSRVVNSGNRIPLVPRHLGKAALEYRVPIFGVGFEATGRSSSNYRGDESNTDPDTIPGFVIFGLYGDYKPLPWLTLFGRVSNLFDRKFATFGVYGEAEETLGEDYEGEYRFIGPGAPRAFFGGVRLQF